MSNLAELQKRALEIREKYDGLEKKRQGRHWTNEELAMGFVGDVGDLIKLVMAKEGARNIDDLDDKLSHELADCLWSVMMLASKFNVDLEEAFLKTMDELERRIEGEAV